MKKLFRSPILGLPMLYLGVALLGVHFIFHLHSNLLLLSALVLQGIGIIFHFWKIKRGI